MTTLIQTSTFPRPTSTVSLQPQQTQNTAPIIEHRCLYTNDLRRKAKRWQDGFLRFHTFNKRVMVYDIPRNYIGDTHWRESYQVQDGDEFELDRPVLVQVGEQVGSIEQDLTGLLQRRHKKDAVVNNRAESHSSSPTVPLIESGPKMGTAIPTQLRPKSLNTLLGTPKGRIGRAALPTKSPHELRRDVKNTTRGTEPPAKRQRVKSPAKSARTATDHQHLSTAVLERRAGEEKLETTPRGDLPTMHGIPRTDEQLKENTKPRAKSRLSTPQSTARVDLIADAKPQLGNFEKPSRKDRCHGENGHCTALQAAASNRRRIAQTRQSEKQETRPSGSCGYQPSTTSTRKESPEPPETIEVFSDVEKSISNSNETAKSTTKLQMATRKPRRKLMYRDLLPKNAPPAGRPSSSADPNSASSRRGSTLERREKQSKDSMSIRHQEEQVRLEARPQRQYVKNRRKGGECLSLSPAITSAEHNRPKNRRAKIPSLSEKPCGRRQMKDILNRLKSPSVEAIEPIIPKANSTVHDTHLALARMDEILFSRSQPSKSSAQAGSRLDDGCSPVQEHSPSPNPPSPPDPMPQDMYPTQGSPKAQEALTSHGLSTTQVPSSQFFETQTTPPSKGKPSREIKNSEKPSGRYSVATSPRLSPPESATFVVHSQKSLSPSVVSPSSKILHAANAPQETLLVAESNANLAELPASTSLETSLAPSDSTSLAQLTAAPSFEAPPVPDEDARLRIVPERVAPNNPQTTKMAAGLPHFRPLRPMTVRQRSPIKKSISHTLVTMGMIPVPDVDNSGLSIGKASGGKEQLTSPWSSEAWDLFGCGRDGVAVSYGDFCLDERV